MAADNALPGGRRIVTPRSLYDKVPDEVVLVAIDSRIVGTFTPAAVPQITKKEFDAAIDALATDVINPLPGELESVARSNRAVVSMGAPRTFSPAPKPSQRGKK